MEKCPVCLIESDINQVDSKNKWCVNCDKCGKFTINVPLYNEIISTEEKEDEPWREKLSIAINKYIKDNNLPGVYINKIITNICINENLPVAF